MSHPNRTRRSILFYSVRWLAQFPIRAVHCFFLSESSTIDRTSHIDDRQNLARTKNRLRTTTKDHNWPHPPTNKAIQDLNFSAFLRDFSFFLSSRFLVEDAVCNLHFNCSWTEHAPGPDSSRSEQVHRFFGPFKQSEGECRVSCASSAEAGGTVSVVAPRSSYLRVAGDCSVR
jgi:hypothetical protein